MVALFFFPFPGFSPFRFPQVLNEEKRNKTGGLFFSSCFLLPFCAWHSKREKQATTVLFSLFFPHFPPSFVVGPSVKRKIRAGV